MKFFVDDSLDMILFKVLKCNIIHTFFYELFSSKNSHLHIFNYQHRKFFLWQFFLAFFCFFLVFGKINEIKKNKREKKEEIK